MDLNISTSICLYRVIVISLLLLWGNVGRANGDTLFVSCVEGYVTIDPLCHYSQTSLPDSNKNALPLIERSTPQLQAQLWACNDTRDTVIIYIYLRNNEYWELISTDHFGETVYRAGALEAHSSTSLDDNKYIIKAILPPAKTSRWILKTWNISTRAASIEKIHVSNTNDYYGYKNRQAQRSLVPTAIAIFFQGSIWIMMLYMFFVYFQNNRDKTYLYYGLYLFFAMYYLLQKVAGDGPFYFLFGENPVVRHVLNEPVQWMIYFFYNLFVIHFLEIKRYSKRLYKILIGINVGYVLYLVGESSYFLLTFDKVGQGTLYIISRIVALSISVYTIAHILLSVKTPLTKYIIIGSTLFITFTFTAMLYSLQLSWLPETALYPINFMQIGILLEMLFFSLGLGKRINLVATEKDQAQHDYIKELKRNEEIVQESNKALSEEVFKRTNEIIYKSKELEKEREQNLKSEYERQLMESEMNSLRLQMNPHFIFNSLNSIRYYILKEDSEKASDYITAFSKLLRMILQHSRERTIKLEDELDALRLYIEFERQRFENKFDYSIRVGDDVDISSIPIQPMLIQPFVENSIWHGLLHKESTGHLWVHITRQKDTLRVEIEDDGIGRDRAREYRSDRSSTYKSMGMEITKDRLRVMAQSTHSKAGYEITDLVNPDGTPAGTRVILKIKIA